MYYLLRCFCVLTLPLASLTVSLGEEADVELERFFKVPDGSGRLTYLWCNDGHGEPEVIQIMYTGSPEWITCQEHPRSRWKNLGSLEEVTLSHTTVTRDECEYIASLRGVTSLQIMDSVYDAPDAIAPLRQMTWLESLSLGFGVDNGSNDPLPESNNAFFEFIEGLVALENLEIWTEIDEETYVRICGLNRLKYLNLGLGVYGKSDIGFNAENAALIANLKQLEILMVQGGKDATPILKGLTNHRHLRVLRLTIPQLDTAKIESIASITRLEKLNLCGKTMGSLSALKGLANIKELNLQYKEAGESDGCRFLASAPQLEILDLPGVVTADFSIEHLRGHKNLMKLGIANVVLSDMEITVLKSMPKLKSVRVANRINSEWYYAAKRRLPSLEINCPSRKIDP